MLKEYLWESFALFEMVGVVFLIWQEKRKFNRQNNYRAEQYKSYGGKLLAEAADRLLWFSGITCVIAGFAMILILDQSIAGWIAVIVLIAIFSDLKRKNLFLNKS